jgi:hypothetical protein
MVIRNRPHFRRHNSIITVPVPGFPWVGRRCTMGNRVQLGTILGVRASVSHLVVRAGLYSNGFRP